MKKVYENKIIKILRNVFLQSSKSEPISHKKFYGNFSAPNFQMPTLIRS